jgi:hypothetical protein
LDSIANKLKKPTNEKMPCSLKNTTAPKIFGHPSIFPKRVELTEEVVEQKIKNALNALNDSGGYFRLFVFVYLIG